MDGVDKMLHLGIKPRMFFWKSSNKLSKNSQKKRDT